MKALSKADNGEKLTDAERTLLDAKRLQKWRQMLTLALMLAEATKAGGVTAESIPFMIEFCLNPASTTGSGSANMMFVTLLNDLENRH